MKLFIRIFLAVIVTTTLLSTGVVRAGVVNQTSSTSNIGVDPNTVKPDGNTLNYLISQDGYSNVKTSKISIFSDSDEIVVYIAGADVCRQSASRPAGTKDAVFNDGLTADPGVVDQPLIQYELKGGPGPSSKDYTYGALKKDSWCVDKENQNLPSWPNGGDAIDATVAATTKRVRIKSTQTMSGASEIRRFDLTTTWYGSAYSNMKIACAGDTPQCLLNQFRIKALPVGADGKLKNGNNTWVSPNPESSADAFAVQAGLNSSSPYSDMRVDFGTDCSVTSASVTKDIVIYDDDNDGVAGGAQREADRQFYLQLEETDRGKPDWSAAKKTWTPSNFDPTSGKVTKDTPEAWAFREWAYPPGKSEKWLKVGTRVSKATIYLKVTMDPDKAYRLRIIDVDQPNVLQFNIPYASVWADYECDYPTKIKPAVTANKTEITVGDPSDTVTWKHRVNNVSKKEDWPDKVASWRVFRYFIKPDNSKVDETIVAQSTSAAATKLPGIAKNTGYDMPSLPAYSYKAVDKTREGWQVCERLEVSPWKRFADGSYSPAAEWKSSEPPPVCATILTKACIPSVTCKPQYVELKAAVTATTETETTTSATFNGKVGVNNFPQPVDGGWGYNELAKQADAERVSAVYDHDGTTSTQSRIVYDCPSGYSPAHPSSYSSTACSRPVTVYDCPSGYSGGGSSSTCTANSPTYYYYCPSGGSLSGSTCTVTTTTTYSCPTKANPSKTCTSTSTSSYPASQSYYYKTTSGTARTYTEYTSPSTVTEYNYYCEETKSWSGYTRSGDPCRDYYKCPNNGAGSGYATSSSGITCQVWQCRYQQASGGRTEDAMVNGATPPKCSYRCKAGKGDKAYLNSSWDDKTGSGDKRCFIQPSFSMTCVWEDGTSKTETVTGNGDYCSIAPTQKSAGAINGLVCAQLHINQPSGWQPSNPQPGMYVSASGAVKQENFWYWTRYDDSKCTRVTGKPFFKIYGGDVRVGGGVGMDTTSCVTNATARIDSFAETDGRGAGAQGGAFAMGNINGFVSGQYNPLYRPKGLSFANTVASTFGGSYAAAPGCVGYRSSTATFYPSNNFPASGLPISGKNVYFHPGNLFINGDVIYSPIWGSIAGIPLMQLVVQGDIYISGNVTHLDGLYAAVSNGGAGGNIYTCATGLNARVTATLSGNCNNPLVVNGALAASRKVYFLRDCGSLAQSQQNEAPRRTSAFGGPGYTCTGSNAAAEIINFTPEQWIGSAGGKVDASSYDAISSLPPIL